MENASQSTSSEPNKAQNSTSSSNDYNTNQNADAAASVSQSSSSNPPEQPSQPAAPLPDNKSEASESTNEQASVKPEEGSQPNHSTSVPVSEQSGESSEQPSHSVPAAQETPVVAQENTPETPAVPAPAPVPAESVAESKPAVESQPAEASPAPAPASETQEQPSAESAPAPTEAHVTEAPAPAPAPVEASASVPAETPASAPQATEAPQSTETPQSSETPRATEAPQSAEPSQPAPVQPEAPHNEPQQQTEQPQAVPKIEPSQQASVEESQQPQQNISLPGINKVYPEFNEDNKFGSHNGEGLPNLVATLPQVQDAQPQQPAYTHPHQPQPQHQAQHQQFQSPGPSSAPSSAPASAPAPAPTHTNPPPQQVPQQQQQQHQGSQQPPQAPYIHQPLPHQQQPPQAPTPHTAHQQMMYVPMYGYGQQYPGQQQMGYLPQSQPHGTPQQVHTQPIQPGHPIPSIQQPYGSVSPAPQGNAPGAPQPIAGGPVGSGLNVKDALSYLEQVKKQFSSKPGVYNHFLDIMKDFKSQSIDTPGVIDRVSSLFRGHSGLILGFNTFLPEGYKIFCSSDPGDPNPVRVVTPLGSHIRPQMLPLSDQQQPQQPQHGQQSPQPQQVQLPQQSPQAQQNPMASVQQQVQHAQQMHLHRQQINANAHLHVAQQQTPYGYSTPEQQHAGLEHSQGTPVDSNANTDRQNGGPVEFNHAINYVNKIKNHFSDQPDIYKQFLEILQTYQREQMRIPDVYAQVRTLFSNAPDLLEGFKNFLPDTENQVPGEGSDVQLPPVGNFGPSQPVVHGQHSIPGISGVPNVPADGLHSQQQQQQQQQQSNGVAGNAIAAMSAGMNGVSNGVLNSNSQFNGNTSSSQAQPNGPSVIQSGSTQAPVSSMRGSRGPREGGSVDTFVPSVKPLGHSQNTLANDVTFFDKVKKTLAKPTYHEFLKVLNLFTQQIIDVPQLVDEVEPFLSPVPDLFDWFKQFVGYEGKPYHIENITFRKHLIDLSQCRAYGRSYRLLPKTERYMPCSGRDELGREVFNDEWVGHPTWASEDSGFVAHRKNQYEEIMFRVEEERHEYDHWIGCCQRTIQVLEVIANRMASMLASELAAFKLPEGLGHGTKIYQKIIRKIYDKKNGDEVINALHENPAAAVPVVLRRLKQKDEEWRRAHREWKKIWREAERKAYYKSLDHVGLTFKQADRKQLTPRALLAEIMAVKAEQGAKRKLAATNLQPLPTPKSQLDFVVTDYDVINDLKDLIVRYVDHRHTMSAHDKRLCKKFLGLFIDEFFTPGPIHQKSIENLVDTEASLSRDSSSPESSDHKEESEQGQDVENVGDNGSQMEEDASNENNASETNEESSKANVDADGDVDMADGSVSATAAAASAETKPEASSESASSSSWLKVDRSTPPLATNATERSQFNLFASTPIYLFMRIFQTIYSRLVEVKGFNDIVSTTLAKSRRTPFAVELGLYDHKLETMGLQFSPENPYQQTLALCYRLIEEEVEVQWFEEALRQAYRNRAYKLYTIDKALQSLVKQLHAVVTDTGSMKALLLWENDRTTEKTSVRDQIELRMRAKQAISGDASPSDTYGAAESSEPLFRIAWSPIGHKISFQHIGPYDVTLKGEMDNQQRWDYYVTSYTMSLPTEGVPLDLIRAPVLQRTVPVDGTGYQFEVLLENLVARIAYGSYKLIFEPGTSDYIVNIPPTRGNATRSKQLRAKRWKDILGSAESALKETEAAEAEETMKVETVAEDKDNDELTPAMLAAQPRLEVQSVDVVLP